MRCYLHHLHDSAIFPVLMDGETYDAAGPHYSSPADCIAAGTRWALAHDATAADPLTFLS